MERRGMSDWTTFTKKERTSHNPEVVFVLLIYEGGDPHAVYTQQ